MIDYTKLEYLVRKITQRAELADAEARVMESLLRLARNVAEHQAHLPQSDCFISGVSDVTAADGLPKRLSVTPFGGLAGCAVYEHIMDYSEPGW